MNHKSRYDNPTVPLPSMYEEPRLKKNTIGKQDGEVEAKKLEDLYQALIQERTLREAEVSRHCFDSCTCQSICTLPSYKPLWALASARSLLQEMVRSCAWTL